MITTIRNGEKIEYVGNGRQSGINIMGKLESFQFTDVPITGE